MPVKPLAPADLQASVKLAGAIYTGVQFEALAPADRQVVLAVENTPLPGHSPAWTPGYRVRYTLRVIGDQSVCTSKTVIARLPTGGWLKPDASDLLVQSASGKIQPMSVLSHDPKGDTIIQFIRNGYDRWYWVYAVNPTPLPRVPPDLQQKLAALEAEMKAALQAKMTAQKAVGDRNDELRKTTDRIAAAQSTAQKAAAEIAQWEKLLPERTAAAQAAAAKVGPAQSAFDQAAAAQAAAAAAADAKTAAAKTAPSKAAEDEALAARLAASTAATAKTEAQKALAKLKSAAQSADNAVVQGQKARADAVALRAESERAVAALAPNLPTLTNAVATAQAASIQAVATARAKSESYRLLAADADPAIHQEGLTLEIREWAGDELDELSNWPVVLSGLQKSANVLGNAIVSEVIQHMNPARPSDPRNFAASYRGFLRINKPGIYRFFVNGDDAAFLFIAGFKVYSRTGSNRPVQGHIPIYSVGTDMELEAGIHPFEIHGVIGNTPGAIGSCVFLWMPPDTNRWALVPTAAFPQALLAAPIAVEASGGAPAAVIEAGLDDSLSSDGVTLYLARFEAAAGGARPETLRWDFGDGTTGTGHSATHVYFQEGDYEVTLQSADSLPPFRRRLHVWMPPAPTSPFALSKALRALVALDLAKLDTPRLNAMFAFLLICEQPDRWPTLERLCRQLLGRQGLDIQYRCQLTTALMESLAQQGRGAEALKLMPPALAEIPRLKTLQADLMLKAADINRLHLKDFTAAERLYEQLIVASRRLMHPAVKQAASAWGDMFLETGDLARAGETYRMAAALGAGRAGGDKATDATSRGALLRVAEQQLKGGNFRQTRRLLQRIESEFPEQKIEGLYRFLRAETDRNGGRYDEAIRNYEALLQLRQWSGYRAQAFYGVADSYYRQGDYTRALEWLASLQSSFPAYFDQKKLAEYQGLIKERARRAQAAAESGLTNPVFRGIETGFETNSTSPPENRGGIRFLPDLGIVGGDAGFIEGLPNRLNAGFTMVTTNLAGEGAFWVEFWYRNTLAPARALINPYATVVFLNSANSTFSQETLYFEPAYGAWRKNATRLKVMPPDGKVCLTFYDFQGLFEIAGLKILPITDAANEALLNFIEGANPP